MDLQKGTSNAEQEEPIFGCGKNKNNMDVASLNMSSLNMEMGAPKKERTSRLIFRHLCYIIGNMFAFVLKNFVKGANPKASQARNPQTSIALRNWWTGQRYVVIIKFDFTWQVCWLCLLL